MTKNNDDGFSLEDMMEIFGDAPAAAPKASPSPAAVATKTPPPAPAPPAPAAEDKLDEDELAILAAYEKSKKDQKARDEEAKRKKEEEARRILEDYERSMREAEEREAREKKEREEKHRRELEALKKKEEFSLDQAKMADEEAKIIEEFERAAREQKEREEAERRAKEAAAQEELKLLAERQKADEERSRAEQARKDEELKQKASEVGKKDSRLLELLAKAQSDIQAAQGLAPLPGAPGSAAAPPPAAPFAPAAASFGDALLDIETKENETFLFLLDETRKAMFTYLAPVIGIKSATNMLNKTVEKARLKAPILLKDANWKLDGTLREDGSVDPDRLLGNASKLPAASRAADYVAGLRELVSLRIKTVEAGLGAHAAAEMKAKLQGVKQAGDNKHLRVEWIKIFMDHVVAPA